MLLSLVRQRAGIYLRLEKSQTNCYSNWRKGTMKKYMLALLLPIFLIATHIALAQEKSCGCQEGPVEKSELSKDASLIHVTGNFAPSVTAYSPTSAFVDGTPAPLGVGVTSGAVYIGWMKLQSGEHILKICSLGKCSLRVFCIK